MAVKRSGGSGGGGCCEGDPIRVWATALPERSAGQRPSCSSAIFGCLRARAARGWGDETDSANIDLRGSSGGSGRLRCFDASSRLLLAGADRIRPTTGMTCPCVSHAPRRRGSLSGGYCLSFRGSQRCTWCLYGARERGGASRTEPDGRNYPGTSSCRRVRKCRFLPGMRAGCYLEVPRPPPSWSRPVGLRVKRARARRHPRDGVAGWQGLKRRVGRFGRRLGADGGAPRRDDHVVRLRHASHGRFSTNGEGERLQGDALSQMSWCVQVLKHDALTMCPIMLRGARAQTICCCSARAALAVDASNLKRRRCLAAST
jgi:hypothetical protein